MVKCVHSRYIHYKWTCTALAGSTANVHCVAVATACVRLVAIVIIYERVHYVVK